MLSRMQETGSGTAGDYAHIFFVEDKGGLATDGRISNFI